jgi:hypothetical protein
VRYLDSVKRSGRDATGGRDVGRESDDADLSGARQVEHLGDGESAA